MTAEGLEALKVPAELVEHELAAKSPLRRTAELGVSLAAVVAIFAFAIPAISETHYSEIWSQFSQLDGRTIAGLTILWFLVMWTYTGVLVAALPGLHRSQALVLNFGGSAVSNVVPFGGAAGVGATYAMGMSWGFPPSAITRSILVTGVWNVFTKLGLPVAALLLLVLDGQTTGGLVVPTLVGLAALAVGIAGFALVLRSDELASRVGAIVDRAGSLVTRLVRRPQRDLRAAVVDFRHQSIGLLRACWKRLTVWMLVYTLGQYLLLLACVRACGGSTNELGWIEVLAAFTFANLLTTIAITPSGVGFVEAGTVAALIAFGGPPAGSAAAVFLFRAFTYLLEIPLGAVGWALWAMKATWRRPVLSEQARRSSPTVAPACPPGGDPERLPRPE
ncbi:lysylphosphatidylglycerol synthase transmembrane domain-containing protein [Rhabdothermincola sp.]|uniref:lysylphosphatidylglycerol synthase transmembrane domain-containing protein n=1 Tax=Rhabdothermincola sp. TaxID=2820405 RepID=UPI002FDFEEE7